MERSKTSLAGIPLLLGLSHKVGPSTGVAGTGCAREIPAMEENHFSGSMSLEASGPTFMQVSMVAVLLQIEWRNEKYFWSQAQTSNGVFSCLYVLVSSSHSWSHPLHLAQGKDGEREWWLFCFASAISPFPHAQKKALRGTDYSALGLILLRLNWALSATQLISQCFIACFQKRHGNKSFLQL